MLKIKAEVLRKRLNKLDEYLAILRGLQKYSFDEFIADPQRYGSVERFLHLAIEAINDMGNHVVAELDLGEVNWYSDIPALLARADHIDDSLQEKWIRMIGFRNTLVHEYIEIDRKIVHDVLRNSLGDLEELRRTFAQFL
ncbi:MAG: DUF86 domain-containing protein [Desulfobacteria bacterium]